MIKLCVEPYCQDCAGFDPVKIGTGIYNSGSEIIYVECRYRTRCQAMYRHLKTEFKKEHNND